MNKLYKNGVIQQAKTYEIVPIDPVEAEFPKNDIQIDEQNKNIK